MKPIDLRTEPTKPYPADDAHRRLAGFVGGWKGRVRTIMDPEAPPLESPWEGEVTPLLGGRFVRVTYRSSAQDVPTAGELTFAFEAGEKLWRLSWIDSFHTGTAILTSVSGPSPGEGPISARATWFAAEGQPHWGWRTEVFDPEGEAWIIRMYNVSPEGAEQLGVEFALTRVR